MMLGFYSNLSGKPLRAQSPKGDMPQLIGGRQEWKQRDHLEATQPAAVQAGESSLREGSGKGWKWTDAG